jgi:hypothetical protein
MRETTATTLSQAHQVRSRWWPGRDAPAATFAEYYRRGAELYKAVAATDGDHRNEATWWASEYRRLADEYAAKIQPAPRGAG